MFCFQGLIVDILVHGVIICTLLGRGSNNTVYTISGARRVVTDGLHCSNSLIAPIRLVFANSDGPTDGSTNRVAYRVARTRLEKLNY